MFGRFVRLSTAGALVAAMAILSGGSLAGASGSGSLLSAGPSEAVGVAGAPASATPGLSSTDTASGSLPPGVPDPASSPWAIQETPNKNTPNGVLVSTSCAAADACIAVGSYYNGSGQTVTLAEGWNGRSWAVQSTPNPPGATQSNLYGVSCSAASFCVAVGSTSDQEVPLVEVWDGTDWAITSTPALSGYLSGVSCTATDVCVAVGRNNSDQLAEVWNGTSWVLTPTPSLSGSLFGVSCSATDACVAVGSALGATLAEVWNGTDWAVQPTPNPEGTNGSLFGVSCSATDACVAVGDYNTSSANQQVTLAEVWNGTSWAITSTPSPGGGAYSSLVRVSCSAANACVAVGSYVLSNNGGALAEVWNGTDWAVRSTPRPQGGTHISLSGVSCSAAKACVAVGYYTISSDHMVTLAEVWNGTRWAIRFTFSPGGPTSSNLSAVSCSAANACVAVGRYNTTGIRTLAQVWNGKRWVVRSTPVPRGSLLSELSSVSCSAAKACVAVGANSNSADRQATLAEAWNGKIWVILPTLDPEGGTNGFLSGVSCSAANACLAVGAYDDTAGQEVTLAEVWDGTSWAIQSTPDPADAISSALNGVSCSATAACVAVGSSNSSSGLETTLAEVWDGTSWAIQSTPNPSGSIYTQLSAVSCSAATACAAVGYASINGIVGLAEVWDGTSWAVQSTPSPAGASATYLNGVSCMAADACVAVGSYNTSSGVQATLAEVGDGTSWASQPTPNPATATASGLNGLACTATGVCVAVGVSTVSTGGVIRLATLVERST